MSFAKIANASFLPLSDTLKAEIKECGEKVRDAIDNKKYAKDLGTKCSLSARLIQWLRYTSDAEPVKFSEIIHFLQQHPTWPSKEQLQKRAEEALSLASSNAEKKLALSWFKKKPPLTGEGWAYYGKLIHKPGQKLQQEIKKAWIEETFTSKGQAAFLKAFKHKLTSEDHFQRCERLLLKGELDQVHTLLSELKPEHLKLIRLRLRLAEKHVEDFTHILDQVPSSQKRESSLLYEQIRWNVARKKDNVAVALFSLFPKSQMRLYRNALWKPRNLLARRLLEAKRYHDAYQIIRNHGLNQGEEFAIGEWLSGWIALRFLKDPEAAKKHFEQLYAHVSTPISKARAAFWMGEAEAADNNRIGYAKFWYKKAVSYPTTFYGQLAASRLQAPLKNLTFHKTSKTPEVLERFKKRSVVQAVQLLHALKRPEPMDPFLLALAHEVTDHREIEILTKFAAKYRSTYAGVWISVKAAKTKVPLINATYPLLKQPHLEESIAPLVHAIIRQESRFGPKEVSSRGAKGMMQLLDSTATEVVRKHKIKLKGGLFDASYNVTVGSKYLEELLQRYSGNLILASAAYNSGPTPVDRWISEVGDPRSPNVDPIDWVESIEYGETRNYVMRVLEAYIVYRQRLGLKPRDLLKVLRGEVSDTMP